MLLGKESTRFVEGLGSGQTIVLLTPSRLDGTNSISRESESTSEETRVQQKQSVWNPPDEDWVQCNEVVLVVGGLE